VSSEPSEPIRLAAEAMATRFELVIHASDAVSARAAGEEALREIVRLEDVFSFYRPGGVLGRLNRRAADADVPVPAILFDLLERCGVLHGETGGAFDPTVGPLMRAWGLAGGPPRVPPERELEAAVRSTGFGHVRLDAGARSVRFDRQGLAVDLGGVAKGRAIDEAATVLEEAGVVNALLHGGTSTVRARGGGPDGGGWRVGIPAPRDPDAPPGARTEAPGLAATVTLLDEALSVSEIAGKGFTDRGAFHGHVLDPRTGRPVTGALLAAVVGPSAAETDALSTALLVLGADAPGVPAFRDPRYRWLVALRGERGPEFVHLGLPPG
jgi:thiamine biosynthesis lipoprotein